MLRASLLIAFSVLATAAHAIPVKTCPQNLRVEFSEPAMDKSYARPGFERYFRENEKVVATLQLRTANNSTCNYETVAGDTSGVTAAQIRGSLRANAKDRAVLVVYSSLPIWSPDTEKLPLGEQVIYFPINSLSPSDIGVAATASVYRVGEVCNWGECSLDYVVLGSFMNVKVTVP